MKTTVHHVPEGRPFPKGTNGASKRVALHLRAAGVDRPGGTPFVTWGNSRINVHVTTGLTNADAWEAALLRLPWRMKINRAEVDRFDGVQVVKFILSPLPEEA